MNCESLTRIDTSSLYKNGRLIAQASSSFMVRRCYDVDFKIRSNVFCYCNKRMLRVCLTTTNIGSSAIVNGILRVRITPLCCNCNCKGNTFVREFYISNLRPGCSENIYLNLPYPCNRKYLITGQIVVNNVLFKEDSIAI